MNITRQILGLTLLLSTLVTQSASAQILPINDLYRLDNINITNHLTQQDFNNVMNRVRAAFAPIVAAHNAQLVITGDWYDRTVNAYASRPGGNIWQVNMFGGLARRPEITQDGFALVVCHELGHHLGGYPFKSSGWAASEGQSDYYATQVCAKRIWYYDTALNAKFRFLVDPAAKRTCDRMWRTTGAQNICYRTAVAALSLSRLLGDLSKDRLATQFDTPTREHVRSTFLDHPQAQCRLDTMLNGAVCRTPFDIRHIPGLEEELQGMGLLEQEKVASRYSCESSGMQFDGGRPACWFKPQLTRWR